MDNRHTSEGILLLGLILIILAAKFFRARKAKALPAWGWTGLGIILLSGLLLYGRVEWVVIYFTPLTWTGYLLLVDGLVWSLRGRSRLGRSWSEFLALAFWSIPLWLIFEAYNLRLENWAYVGLPASPWASGIGFVWSFATIWPAICETADFVRALGFWREEARPLAFSVRSRIAIFVVGLVLVMVPVLVSPRIGGYMFGAVWVGFALLLDPVNYHWKGRSLLAELAGGQRSNLYSLLASGLVCGMLWEFWNYWAGARWVYVFPISQSLKVFEMPLPGYLGFPPFALECFVIYEFLETLRRRLPGVRHQAEMEPA